MKTGSLNILMLEDEQNDVYFVRRALAKLGARHTLHAVHNGGEALRYLCGEGEYKDRSKFPMPNIIFTDLKMPGMDGFEFLRWLRDHPECLIIPTIVYSSSTQDSDVRKAYALGANSYVAKPSGLAEMTDFLKFTSEYWSRCELPPPVLKC